MIKVQPKPFVSLSGKSINIVGINAKFINDFPVSIEPIDSFQFYSEFITDEGEKRDVINAYSSEFLNFIVGTGIEEAEAKAMLSQVFGALLIGTREQRFEAISSLASFYNYELLTINEQKNDTEFQF